jgi:hypothetical protein
METKINDYTVRFGRERLSRNIADLSREIYHFYM